MTAVKPGGWCWPETRRLYYASASRSFQIPICLALVFRIRIRDTALLQTADP